VKRTTVADRDSRGARHDVQDEPEGIDEAFKRRPMETPAEMGEQPPRATTRSPVIKTDGSDYAFASAEIAITSVHHSSLGGCVVIGRDETNSLRRGVMPAKVLPRAPEVGETWRITGAERAHVDYGLQIHAVVALPLLPRGRAIVRFLAVDRRFPGVGWASATRLWDKLGDNLYREIRDRKLAELAEIVGPERAVAIIHGFALLADEVAVFEWLDRYGVSPRTAGASVGIWGRGAIEKIAGNPYALALLEPWHEVDARALRLGVAPQDHRRLSAAVEEALSVRFRKGDMAARRTTVAKIVRGITSPYEANGDHAIKIAVESGRVLDLESGRLQSRACSFMEREIERLFRERLSRSVQSPTTPDVLAAIAETEKREGYTLTKLQREAVFMAVSSGIGVITGGAGTGKTTVVKAILAASARRSGSRDAGTRASFEYPQLALAGRAAKRIAETTGQEAATIARFIHQLEQGGRRLQKGLMIFDESSMVDVPSIYRILSQVPSEVDLLFIGDPAQLPPIGPGMLFRRMVEAHSIPQVHLDVIHRQAAATGIPTMAASVREGTLPDLPHFDPRNARARGVFLVPTTREQTGAAAIEVFRAMAGPPPSSGSTQRLHDLDIQILAQIKNGSAGTNAINRAIQYEWMAHQPPVADWGVSLGSKMLWLRNDYKKSPALDRHGRPVIDPSSGQPKFIGFMNGALGIVQREVKGGAWIRFDDGAEDAISIADLVNMSYGWAISVHKAQGSAFRRVIIPIVRSRILDRSIIYTAITRAVETAVLVGDPAAIRDAVAAAPLAIDRVDGMDLDRCAF
jgi:exodeoxyribonuclease V alpha subunit